jgi:putative selenate reductase
VAHLVPYAFGRLVSRVLRELEAGGPVLDLPRAKVARGGGGCTLSAPVHGHVAASPVGPAAGPQTQLAQNILLAFLAGSRVFELKTVQMLDALSLPRPCIDVRTVGFNVEWSQELTLRQSLEEYVKASMLLEIVVASGRLGLEPGFDAFVFDLSVGYDLKGVQSAPVRAFLAGMLDASELVDRLRAEIPEPYARFRDLPFRRRISDSVTLSTFHGCPPSEIEGLARFLMQDVGLHCVVKLNPTLLGKAEARRLLNQALGYGNRIPDSAFDADPSFEQAVELVGRLEGTARATGRGFGVKFSNTLVVENDGGFLPRTEPMAYLSGQPLHVLAMTLVERFRGVFGDRLPVSFSAGIDRHNFADAVALGLCPVTVCTDLLRPGGYGRLAAYLDALGTRMRDVGARTLEDFVLRAQGQAEAALARSSADALTLVACRRALAEGADLRAAAGEHFPRWVSEARLLNTAAYVATLAENPRYAAAATRKAPPKVGTRLELFDCLTCDKCVPVCPNHANFTYVLPAITMPVVTVRRTSAGSWEKARSGPPLRIAKKHQLANFADFCNECGNCDVFCPEEGGPYLRKPRFFGSRGEFARRRERDGFFLSDAEVLGRIGGREYRLEPGPSPGSARFSGESFWMEIDEAAPDAPLPGGQAEVGVEVDLTCYHLLLWVRRGVLESATLNYLNA